MYMYLRLTIACSILLEQGRCFFSIGRLLVVLKGHINHYAVRRTLPSLSVRSEVRESIFYFPE